MLRDSAIDQSEDVDAESGHVSNAYALKEPYEITLGEGDDTVKCGQNSSGKASDYLQGAAGQL